MSENPYESPETVGVVETRRPTITLPVRLLIYGAIIAVVVALLLPAPRGAREAARRNQCLNHLKQIALAMHNYHDEHGHLPPAYTVDDEGNPLHSWRTLLLPYLEQQALYDSIDLTKPWNDPGNAAARETVVPTYLCPSYPGDETHATYMVMVGPETAFAGSTPRSLADIKDGTANTILVVEVGPDDAVEWMAPKDITIEAIVEREDLATLSRHPGGFQAAYADGHVTTITDEIDREVLRALLTIAGGEEIPEE